jgi:hypothetical protein
LFLAGDFVIANRSWVTDTHTLKEGEVYFVEWVQESSSYDGTNVVLKGTLNRDPNFKVHWPLSWFSPNKKYTIEECF